MAPSSTPAASLASAAKRQEACALSCLSSTDMGSCVDAACLCASSSWDTAVLTCFQTTCESESSLDSAYTQLLAYCAAIDISFTMSQPAFTQTATATVSATATSSEPALATTTPAVASASSSAIAAAAKPVDISTIMAGVCSFLFALALVIGYFGIRDKLRRARHHSAATKPSAWSGGGQAVASSRPGNHLRSAATRKTAADAGGAHSSIYGADTSHFDTAGYADLELEDRRQQARREREKAADLIRQENLHGLFAAPAVWGGGATVVSPSASTSSASASSPRLPALSRTSSFASSAKGKHGHKTDFALSSDSDADDDDDGEGQYVTLPRLGMGLGRGEVPLGTASTYAGAGGGLSSAGDDGAWARTPPGDSSTALQTQQGRDDSAGRL